MTEPQVMDGYIRVSRRGGRDDDSFHSPEVQKASIESWAKANNVRIAEWWKDIDRSGGTMDRPGMNAARRRIDEGKSTGLVVARFDRFARTLIGGLTIIEELDSKGARVVSVAEGMDPATAIGRAVRDIILVMAQLVREQAKENTAAGVARAIEAGHYPKRPSYGYRMEESTMVVDDDAAKVVERIFKERAAGVGWRKIAADLTRDGIPTPTGRKHWSLGALEGIVSSKSPLGIFVNGATHERAWDPIIDGKLWEDANAVTGHRDSSRKHHDRLFAGIARCACCGYVTTRTVNPNGFVSYSCSTRTCEERTSIGAGLLDAHVGALVDDKLAAILMAPRPSDDGGEGDRLKAECEAAQRDLEELRDDIELRDALGVHDWRLAIMAKAADRDAKEAARAEYRSRSGIPDELQALPDGFVPTLADFPWEVQRRIVERYVHSVWIRRSRHRGAAATRHVGDRLRVVWAEDPDAPELPRSSRKENFQPVRW